MGGWPVSICKTPYTVLGLLWRHTCGKGEGQLVTARLVGVSTPTWSLLSDFEDAGAGARYLWWDESPGSLLSSQHSQWGFVGAWLQPAEMEVEPLYFAFAGVGSPFSLWCLPGTEQVVATVFCLSRLPLPGASSGLCVFLENLHLLTFLFCWLHLLSVWFIWGHTKTQGAPCSVGFWVPSFLPGLPPSLHVSVFLCLFYI